MEDARHRTGRALKVEREVEWSRLEEQTMTSVYERLVPIVGGPIQAASDWRCQAPWPQKVPGMTERALGA